MPTPPVPCEAAGFLGPSVWAGWGPWPQARALIPETSPSQPQSPHLLRRMVSALGQGVPRGGIKDPSNSEGACGSSTEGCDFMSRPNRREKHEKPLSSYLNIMGNSSDLRTCVSRTETELHRACPSPCVQPPPRCGMCQCSLLCMADMTPWCGQSVIHRWTLARSHPLAVVPGSAVSLSVQVYACTRVFNPSGLYLGEGLLGRVRTRRLTV